MNRLALNAFYDLNREMDRFLGLRRRPRRGYPYSRVSCHPGRTVRSWPLVNVSQDADNIYVEALAPGVAPDSLDVSMTGEQLTISGERSALPDGMTSEGTHRKERASGRFHRSATLPTEVDRGKIDASYKNGLLKITLPKAEEVKPKKIQVNVN